MIRQMGPDTVIVEGSIVNTDGSVNGRVGAWGAKAMMGSKGAPSSIGCRLAQHGSQVSKHNSLRVVATGVYDGGTPERRAGPDPRESLHPRRSPPPRRPETAAGTLARPYAYMPTWV